MVRGHPVRPLVVAALASFAVLAVAVLAPGALRAASQQLLTAKEQATQLAAQIADLDQGIGAAADRCTRAGDALRRVRSEIRRNRRLQESGRVDLRAARATLAQRAVALYKQDDVSTLAAILSADDFSAMVGTLAQVHEVVGADKAMLRHVVRAQRRLARHAATLADERRTATRLVRRRDRELAAIKAQLGARQALLDSTRADIRHLVALRTPAPPAPQPQDQPSGAGGSSAAPTGGSSGGSSAGQDGSGPWWSLIQQAAAVNGVSARGMYSLMMVESGGDASVVGPGGYFGLFQYAPSTWKGAWNPYRGQSITDGAAQIRATALALRLGYGHSWWDPSYSYAFGGG
jgi:peptidoglycan hydrolase CwlO-like protein